MGRGARMKGGMNTHPRFVALCRELCRMRKSKRVDEACRLRVGLSVRLREGLERVLRTYTLSPLLVSLRFVSTLCPYAFIESYRVAGGWLFFIVLEPGTADPAATTGTAGGGASVCLPAAPWTSRRSFRPPRRPVLLRNGLNSHPAWRPT